MTPNDPLASLPTKDTFMDSLLNPAGSPEAPIIESSSDATPEPEIQAEPEAINEAEAAPETTEGEEKKGMAALLDDDEKPEEKTEEEPVPPAIAKDAKAGDVFKAIRAEKKTAELEVKRLQAELDEVKKVKAADPTDKITEELRAAIKERDQRLARYSVRESEAFKNEVEIPLASAKSALEALAKESEIPVDKLYKAIYSDRANYKAGLAEALEAVSEIDKLEILSAAKAVRDLEIKGMEIEENAKPAAEEAKTLEKKAAEQASIERKASQMRAVTDTAAKLKSLMKLLTVEGGASEEAIAASILEEAQATPFDEMEVADQAAAVLALPTLVKAKAAILHRDKTIESLRRQLGGKASASPKAGDAAPAPAGGGTEDIGFNDKGLPGSNLVSAMFKGVPGY